MIKETLRKQSLDSRRSKDVLVISSNVIKKIINSNILANYRNIGIYYPLKYEIDLRDLVKHYTNKSFYIPRINNENLLEFALYDTNFLKKGPFKTFEPIGPLFELNELDCIFIPCVAISNNRRIGYGKGYYDRSLVNYNGIKIGVCYKDSIFNYEIDDYDIKFDIIFEGDTNEV